MPAAPLPSACPRRRARLFGPGRQGEEFSPSPNFRNLRWRGRGLDRSITPGHVTSRRTMRSRVIDKEWMNGGNTDR